MRPFRETPPAGRADYCMKRRPKLRTRNSAAAQCAGAVPLSCRTANQKCACRTSFQMKRNDIVRRGGDDASCGAALRKHTTRRACGGGRKRIGGFGRAAHRDGLPVCICFPEACTKVISGKTACQTFLTDGKKVSIVGRAGRAARVRRACRCFGADARRKCRTGGRESYSPSPVLRMPAFVFDSSHRSLRAISRHPPSPADPSIPESRPAGRARARRSRPMRRRSRRAAGRYSGGVPGRYRRHRNCIAY